MNFRTLYTLALLLETGTVSLAQSSGNPIIPLNLKSELRTTSAQFGSTFGRRCGESGSVYLRTAPHQGGALSAPITRIDPTGSVQTINMAAVDGLCAAQMQSFAVGANGAMFQVIGGYDHGSATEPRTYLVQFDKDGSVRSKTAFDVGGDFYVPAFIPLPSGDTFVIGQIETKDSKSGKTLSRVLAGFFGPDGRLKRTVRRSAKAAYDPKGELQDPELQNGEAQLGDDGRVYLMLASAKPRVKVINQSGEIEREFSLASPLPKSHSIGMLVSGGRLAIRWQDDSEEPKEGALALYSANTGDLLRTYREEYVGSPICFEDGKTLRILTVQKSGYWALGTAEVQ